MWCMTPMCGYWSVPATRRSSSPGRFSIALHSIWIDDHRRNALRQVESLEVLDTEERYFIPSPHNCLDHGQRLEMLQRALAELPRLCRESFLLRKIDGLSHPEIAENLGISRALVEKHIVNAMKHCRVRIKQWDAH